MIKKKGSLLVAENILGVLNQYACNLIFNGKKSWYDIFYEKSIWIESFDNCIEQGYVIKVSVKGKILHIAFSEDRNTDKIVVYNYYNTSFNNLPDEDGWKNCKYFEYGNYIKAVKYILELIKKEILRENENE